MFYNIDKLTNKAKKQILHKSKQKAVKGGGLGNAERKEGKKCPPPFASDDGPGSN